MTKLSLPRELSLLGALASAWLVPQVALACPMCFSGNGQNQSAFLYGSLFLMFVPVTAIGSLVYWGYRRYRAWDEVPPEPPKAPHVAGATPALRIVGRR
jgi:hypothetical protein